MSRFRLRGRRRRNRAEARNERIPVGAIVPNLITSLAACAGITSISLSSEGRFLPALWALLFAAACDGIDGRVARLLKASSRLGAELDSLADFVNFGVAPAMFMYFWMTGGPTHVLDDGTVVSRQLVRIVLACSLYYAMCDCFRLARFNTMLEQPTLPYWKHFFTGVPAPGGCWMVLTPAILSIALEAKGRYPALATLLQNPTTGVFMLLAVGTLMASRIPTVSLKALKINRRYQLPIMAALLLVIAFMVANFWLALGTLGVLYIVTLPVSWLAFRRVKSKFESRGGLTSAPDKR
ncbi:MAG: phosphatidylcholine/phosphatidylserine synthase [Kiritimatiellae bacterium]|nr:phosphatidylcholine/phosphatidylserine synthase [Kiritimatiellia bacterium]